MDKIEIKRLLKASMLNNWQENILWVRNIIHLIGVEEFDKLVTEARAENNHE